MNSNDLLKEAGAIYGACIIVMEVINWLPLLSAIQTGSSGNTTGAVQQTVDWFGPTMVGALEGVIIGTLINIGKEIFEKFSGLQ